MDVSNLGYFVQVEVFDKIQIIDKVTTEIVPETAIDITYAVIMSIIACVVFISLWKYPPLKKYDNLGAKKWGGMESTKTPYDNFDEQKLQDVTNKLSGYYRMLIGIFGILLAFIIADKIILSLVNIGMILWTSWVLAIIIRMGSISLRMSDLFEIDYNLTYRRRNVYAYREFFKTSLIFLIVSVVLVPSFFVLPIPTDDYLDSLPWTPSISLLIISAIIAGMTVVFHTFIMIFSGGIKGTKIWLYGLPVPYIIMAVVGMFAGSPLEPVFVSFVNFDTHIPSIMYWTSSFVHGAAYAGLFFIGRALLARYKELQKN